MKMLKLTSSLALLILVSLVTTSSYAQNDSCNCKTDIDFLLEKIKKTPPYKINKESFNKRYKEISGELSQVDSDYECFVLLNKLLLGLNDNHSKVHGLNVGATTEILGDENKLSAFKKSALFNAYLRPQINLDSLKTALSSKKMGDIEGIYTRSDYMDIAVYQDNESQYYKAVVINSEKEIWGVGELIYTLVPYGNDYLLNIGGSLSSKRLIAYTERIQNGLFLTMGFQKDNSVDNYSKSIHSDTKYIRQKISSEISYIKIGSFSGMYPTLSDAENFYKSLDGTLDKKNLIIDLRDNGGGGDRNSKILYKIIKNYLKNNNVYIISNHRTTSNAEQFIAKLNKSDNCTVLGHRTNGTVTYETGNANYNLPCDKFLAILTHKKHKDYLKYESQGIDPDVVLDMESDWLDQVVEYIQNN